MTVFLCIHVSVRIFYYIFSKVLFTYLGKFLWKTKYIIILSSCTYTEFFSKQNNFFVSLLKTLAFETDSDDAIFTGKYYSLMCHIRGVKSTIIVTFGGFISSFHKTARKKQTS